MPVLAYHYPKVSAPGVPVDVLRQLPVAGIKDSSGDAERLLLEADEIPSGLYTGAATLIHLAGAIGCSGAILALANIDPEGCLHAWKGDGTVQRELISGHRSNALAGIAGLKRALCALHGTSPSRGWADRPRSVATPAASRDNSPQTLGSRGRAGVRGRGSGRGARGRA